MIPNVEMTNLKELGIHFGRRMLHWETTVIESYDDDDDDDDDDDARAQQSRIVSLSRAVAARLLAVS